MHPDLLVEGRSDEIAMACCSGGDEAVRSIGRYRDHCFCFRRRVPASRATRQGKAQLSDSRRLEGCAV